MRKINVTIIGAMLLAAFALMLSACNTSNTGATALPERSTSDLCSVVQFEGLGTFTPVLEVSETADTVTAEISADDAVDLASVALHLDYDSTRLTPVDVEISDFLGAEGEAISFTITDRIGYVPVGITQIMPSGVTPRSGYGLLATVTFEKSPAGVRRNVSYVGPTSSNNDVDDLAIINQGAGTVDLYWSEVNKGDYNNDGIVGVTDITPIGQYYDEKVTESSNPDRVALIDGNDDGFITVSDFTPIGQNYDAQVSGYKLYTDETGGTAYGDGITITREDAKAHADNANFPNHAVRYNFTATLPGGPVAFTVRPVCGTDLGRPGPYSNTAEIIIVEGPPEPPSDVTAVSTATQGHMKVLISWTASTSADAKEYVVERQLDSAAGTWTEIGTVSAGGADMLLDDEMTKLEEPYTYRIKTVDLETPALESGWVESNSVTPYVVFLPAPENLVVDNAIATPNAINISWDPPGLTSDINGYRVYNADTLEALYTTPSKLITEWTHTELTAGTTYNYYVVSVGQGGTVESAPSNTAGTTPSVYVEDINITAFTTDKTTHYYGASETPSNLVVTTDLPADNVVWDAGGGQITGSGQSVTWLPTMLMDTGLVTVNVTVHRGSAQDTAQLNLYVTTGTIKATYGQGGGHYIDFTASCLHPLSTGGNISDRTFSEFATVDHAIIFDRWDAS